MPDKATLEHAWQRAHHIDRIETAIDRVKQNRKKAVRSQKARVYAARTTTGVELGSGADKTRPEGRVALGGHGSAGVSGGLEDADHQARLIQLPIWALAGVVLMFVIRIFLFPIGAPAWFVTIKRI